MSTKKTKKIASEQMKQSRAKTESDKIYNARRRAKRAVEKLRKQIIEGGLSTEEVQKANDLIRSFNEVIDKSYAKRIGREVKYAENIEDIKKTLENAPIQSVVSKAEIDRKNEIWKRNLNQATKSDGVSPISKEETRMFFRVTQRFWNIEGVSMSGRLDAILRGLGVSTIQEAFNLVMKNKYVQEALEKSRSYEDGTSDEKDEIGSPDYAVKLINKIEKIFSMQGNPFTYENLISNET